MTTKRYTYAFNSVDTKRKDTPEVWITTDKVNGQMFSSYPVFEFIPDSNHDTEPMRYGDFVIDIDTIEIACQDAIKIILWFEKTYGIYDNQWRIYLSGKKGVHLELPAEIMGLEDGHVLLPRVYKRLAKDLQTDLSVSLDISMYNLGTGKPYRRPNVLRDCGTYKVQIEFNSLYEINTEEDYRNAASAPIPLWDVTNKTRCNLLANKMAEYLAEAVTAQESLSNQALLDAGTIERLAMKAPPCISFLANCTTFGSNKKKPTFNDIAMQLAAYAITAGQTEQQYLSDCAAFISSYPSSSLNTSELRKRNCQDRFRTMAVNEYQHSCGGILALGFSSFDFDCKRCSINNKTDWPEPSPLIIHEQAVPYPLDALPGIIRAAVREVVDFVQCPVALGACSALAVVSTVTQGLIDVRRADKLDGPTSLFLLAIADSGERKTTVDGFFSKPIQQWEAEKAESAKPDLQKYAAAIETWEAKKSGLLAAIKDASKGGRPTVELENKVSVLELQKPEPPKVPRLIYDDSTPEAQAYGLAHEWPVGCVLTSEAGCVFGSHAMGKDSAMRNMAMLNKLWGAETLKVDRRSVPSYTVRGARLSMGLAVQSETVRSFLDSSKGLARGIGWLARFLIAWPESTQGSRPFKDPPSNWPHLAKFHRRLGALLDQPLTLNDRGELEPETLELSPEAKAVWVAFHNDVEAELRPGRDMAEAKDVASKAADNAARLAALLHLFENDPGGTIGPDHMRKAAALASWHLYEARRFMGEIALPVALNNAAKLDAWLLGYCRQNQTTEISTTTILQNGPPGTREKITLTPALDELEEAGRVKLVKDGRLKLVKINPALLRG